MKKITRKELDDVVAQIVKQREKIEPYVSKYQQEIAPKIKEYAEKAVTEYREKAAPKILQHKKVMTTLFYMYTNTTVYKSSKQRLNWQAVVGRVKR
jgi:hypothetical protein